MWIIGFSFAYQSARDRHIYNSNSTRRSQYGKCNDHSLHSHYHNQHDCGRRPRSHACDKCSRRKRSIELQWHRRSDNRAQRRGLDLSVLQSIHRGSYQPIQSRCHRDRFDRVDMGNGLIGPIELPATGTYTIVISPVGTSGGSASYQITNYSDLSSSVNTSDTYAQTILSDNPIGYWRLDESSLATAANAEPTGVQYGEPGPTSPDNAIAIKGSQTYVSTTTEFNNPQTFSLEVWFNTTTAEGGRLAGFENVQVGEGSTAYDRLLYMTNSGNVVFGIYNGGFQTVQSSSTYSDGNWHHAVATYSSGAAVLYVDGNSVATGNLGQAQDYSGWWRWGGGSAWGGGGGTWTSTPIDLSFKGLLGEAALYSTALTASQVSTHYAAAAGGNYDSTVSSDDPVGYWKLNESGGLTLADSSGNADNGTVQIQAFNGVYQGGVTLWPARE